ncbi:hypothetical protein UVI_02039110 [Ustilaginoidea virens]|uniref:Ribosomal protein YmL11, mitochondrial n=1 Tax=Ustilaginoidea virens TaxID=1159556 RepID=A0A1B5LAC4_USTVR|nr:hypothetical protein UVI_02039110 [Ustilaginoidea virens]
MRREVATAGWSSLRLLLPKVIRPEIQIAPDRLFSTTRSFEASRHAEIMACDTRFASRDAAMTSKLPSARPVETRKSQLIRSYTSLLRTTPLVLFFQHSNLTAIEWAAVRRELKKAVQAVPQSLGTDGSTGLDLAAKLQLQVMRTKMLSVALRITEFHKPDYSKDLPPAQWLGPVPLVHDLSEAAYKTIKDIAVPPNSAYAQLQPLMVGPVAALTLPCISTAHLAAALSILAPVAGVFPAPTRKKNPGFYDPICQNGLNKLVLVGGRIEGKVFDEQGVNWVGGIQGGLDGLRAQLVSLLQRAGLGVTTSLHAVSMNVWLALESRRAQLDEGDK